MIQPRREREHGFRRLFKDLPRRPRVLGRVARQLVFERLLEIAVPGFFFGQAIDALDQELRRLLRKVEHLFGRP